MSLGQGVALGDGPSVRGRGPHGREYYVNMCRVEFAVKPAVAEENSSNASFRERRMVAG